jgi:hypothetical protein
MVISPYNIKYQWKQSKRIDNLQNQNSSIPNGKIAIFDSKLIPSLFKWLGLVKKKWLELAYHKYVYSE